MGKHNAAAILALTLVWTGCSIKEDRMICPCFLTEEFGDVSPVEEGDDPWISILGEGGGVVQQKTIHGNMFREGDRYVATVPKQILSVAVTYGMKHYTIDGGTERREVTIISIGNGRYIGGGMMAVPHAEIDDGLFDVVVVDKVNRFAILRLLSRFIKGKHTDLPIAHETRCTSLTIRCPGMTVNMDGELLEMDSAEC